MTNPYRGSDDPTRAIPGVPQGAPPGPDPTRVMPAMPPSGGYSGQYGPGPGYAPPQYQQPPSQYGSGPVPPGQYPPGYGYPPQPPVPPKKSIWPAVLIAVLVTALVVGGAWFAFSRGLIPGLGASASPSASVKPSAVLPPTKAPPIPSPVVPSAPKEPAPKTGVPKPATKSVKFVFTASGKAMAVYVDQDAKPQNKQFTDSFTVNVDFPADGRPAIIAVTAIQHPATESSCEIFVDGQSVKKESGTGVVQCMTFIS